MYVNPQPLTFADLARATLRSAGLGQGDLSTLPDVSVTGGDLPGLILASAAGEPNDSGVPLSNQPIVSGSETNPSSPNYNPYAVALAAAGTPGISWGTVALIGGGLFILAMLAGKR